MSTVTTARPTNLRQLSEELGGAPLSSSATASGTTITCHDENVTQAQLQAAIDAHVAVDESGNRTTIEDQALIALQNNRAFLDIANPTNAQAISQIRALTRQNNGIIRLILNKLEGTD